MPCNGGNYFGRERVCYIENPDTDKALVEAIAHIDLLTRRLCKVCSIIYESEELKLPTELDEWYYEHRLEDEARIEEAKQRKESQLAEERRKAYLESVRERILEQLSDDEKEALNLKDK